MAEYLYSARNNEGKRYAGSVEAPDKATALQMVSERFAIVTRLERKVERRGFLRLVQRSVPGEDLLSFSQTMAAMLEGGITMKRALEMVYIDAENTRLRVVALELAQSIDRGESLSEAMSGHDDVFNDFFVKMVRAGEESGELPEMLTRVARYVERSEFLADKVKNALTYPLIVFVFALLLMTLLLAFGIPYLESLYSGLGIVLPMLTQVLVGVGGFLGNNVFLLSILTVAGVYGMNVLLTTSFGQLQVDRLKLKLPVFGSFFHIFYTARFAQTLALLYSSGIPLHSALKLTGESIGNRVVAEACLKTCAEVEEGLNLSDALRANPYFLDTAIGMVAAGEESGSLDEMLNKVASFYDHRAQTKLETLTATIEPLMMVGIGLAVAVLILALGLPFMTLATNL